MSFDSLGLSEALVRAVAEAGYTQPTPIQSQAIPVVLSGKDLLAGAQTGTGKTAAFVLPILQRLMQGTASAPPAKGARKIRSLILAPTRELAAQVEESVRTYGKHSQLRSCAVYGGVSINPQIETLRRGVDILVATPGRLLDHHGQRTVDLSHVEVLVLDEADRMLDMGFLPDIKRVLAALPRQRQNLLFSATFAEEIRTLAESLLKSPAQIQVTPRNSTVESVAQRVHPVDSGRKAELLVHLVKEGNWYQVLVFTRTKHGANRLAARLEKSEIPALAIHGNKSQAARTRALAEFKSGKLQVLVATDIAARGLDIEQLPHVVNFDIPNVPEDYVHRIGRTGRAGAVGEAISLVSSEERGSLRDIERLIKRSIPSSFVEGFEPGRPGAKSEGHPEQDARPARSPRQAARPQRAARTDGHRKPAQGRSAAGGQRKAAPGEGSAGSDHRRSTQAEPSTNGHRRPAQGESSANGHRRPAQGESSANGHRRPAQGEATAHPRSAGAPSSRKPGGATHSPRSASVKAGEKASGASQRRSGARPGASAADPLVRSNLPPGWMAAGAKRR
jgi:ATP-dependent RNA helicase RhlE